MNERSKEEVRLEYEKDYLERLTKQGKIKSEQEIEATINEEERARKVEEAEKIQIESALQIQEASAAKIQLEIDNREKQEFLNKEVLLLIEELKELRKQISTKKIRKKAIKKKVAPKRKTAKRKTAKKKKNSRR